MMTTSTTDRFSAHYCERLQYNWVDFLFANSHTILRLVDFVSYLRGLFPDSFQITKRQSYLCLLHLNAKFQLNRRSDLLCRRDDK